MIVLLVFQLVTESYPVWEKEGLGFIIGTDWNAVDGRESFGALPYILGTLITAALAMLIGVPLSIGIAMFISDAPAKIGGPLGFVVELLAAVPSVIYGLWGLFVFRIYFRDWIEAPLHEAFGDSIFLFSGTPFGLDILTASVILAIMIIPTVSAVAREVMRAVPQQQKEAAYMLGATKWEMFKLAVFPYSKTGLIGASILGLGRAVGETMAVTMLIGNATGIAAIPSSFFDPGQTMSSIIANEFVEGLAGIGPPAGAHRCGAGAAVNRDLHQRRGAPSCHQDAQSQGGCDKQLSTSSERRQEYRALFKQNVRKRLLVDKAVRIIILACVVIAIIPLGSILVEVFRNGITAISIEFLTEVPGSIGSGEGGIGPAIQGTLIIIGLASLIGVPVGVMSGIFLSEYGDNSLARTVRFFNDVFMEFPSIVLGIFAFLVIVLILGHFSVWAGAFALSLIMFPIVARTTEESLKMVPVTYREAGIALGLKKWVITLRIVITAAKSGMITGVLLSVSRIGGETAPLIMTILGSSQFLQRHGRAHGRAAAEDLESLPSAI